MFASQIVLMAPRDVDKNPTVSTKANMFAADDQSASQFMFVFLRNPIFSLSLLKHFDLSESKAAEN